MLTRMGEGMTHNANAGGVGIHALAHPFTKMYHPHFPVAHYAYIIYV
jgi:hypothetical protein